MKQPAIYIMASGRNGTIYTGVSAYLAQRVYQHKNPTKKCFTSEHECFFLVYYEMLATMKEAIDREDQLKTFSRKKKFQLIESKNPNWYDLYLHVL